MRNRLRSGLSYANVMATIAVFLSLGGGAYAIALRHNQVKARHIAPNAVGASEIRRNAVRRSELAARAVSSTKVVDGSLLAKDFAAGQLPRPNPNADLLDGI